MTTNATWAIVGFTFGGIFLLLALVSTLSKVTLVVFNPWLLRELRYRDQPRAFTTVVFLYWLLGAAGVAGDMAALAGLRL
jgi:hypothetical protein